jgi:phage regulator Rha-like protein
MNKENNQLQVDVNRAEEIIKQRIFIIRGHKVMIDTDLAELYEIKTKDFNRSVKRNLERFPNDFMFQLSIEESKSLRFQIGTSKIGRGGRRYLPYVFTEHGVAMLSSVLNSKQAIQMNIFIIRAFIKMRESLDKYKDLAVKIGEIELQQREDHIILKDVYDVVKFLTDEPIKPKEKLGFNINI